MPVQPTEPVYSPRDLWIAGRASVLEAAGVSASEARAAAEAAWHVLPTFKRRLFAASVPARPVCAVLSREGAN